MYRYLLTYGAAGDGEFEEPFRDFAAMLRRMEEISKKYRKKLGIPYSVDLYRQPAEKVEPVEPLSEHLSVGTDEDQWMVFFHPGDNGSHCLNSLGDETATGFVPFFFGDYNEPSRKHLVPRAAAIKAVKDWLETGALSDAISWTTEMF